MDKIKLTVIDWKVNNKKLYYFLCIKGEPGSACELELMDILNTTYEHVCEILKKHGAIQRKGQFSLSFVRENDAYDAIQAFIKEFPDKVK